MIRPLLSLATPFLALGLAAGFVAPSLVAGSGAPMLVAAQPDAAVQTAHFEGEGCLSDLAFSEAEPSRVVTLLLRTTGGASGPSAGLLVIFSHGGIMAVRQATETEPFDPDLAAQNCQPDTAPTLDGSI